MPNTRQGAGGIYDPPAALPTRPDTDTQSPDSGEDGANSADAIAFVYVPTRPYRRAERGQTQHVRFELRQLDDGSPGLAVFTAKERLVAELGIHQPYVRIAALDLLVQVAGAKVRVVIDPELRQGVPRWTEANLQAWRENDDD
ncbi:hypothetical protein [Actinoallomurus sp. CA-150999]|uniref:hypothetical protein n=1 Tax=Actinoallomurus sp. CA-150999 TaxID=3239887 RepID=UPI003D8B2AE7